jgi:hypothetical protein
MNIKRDMKDILANAYDFLDQAIAEVKDKPKYSIIHFYTALELLVKARLMHEHWTLVLTKPENADQSKFASGDFHSVTLEAANKRLVNIVGDGLTDHELDVFDAIRKLRNKWIHFFHREVHGSEKYVAELIEKQFIAMYHLHKIIHGRWKRIFQEYSDVDFSIDRRMQAHKDYLMLKYEQIKADIYKQVKGDAVFIKCPVCDFHALNLNSIDINDNAELFIGKCFLCRVKDQTCLAFSCGQCDEKVFAFESDCECTQCHKKYIADEIGKIIDVRNEYQMIKDGDVCANAHCSECEGYESVLPLGSFHVCSHCLAYFEKNDIFQCEYCGSFNTEQFEHSYLSGCIACDGKYGSESYLKE